MEPPYCAILCRTESDALQLLSQLRNVLEEWLNRGAVVRCLEDRRAELYYREGWSDEEYDEHRALAEITQLTASSELGKTEWALVFTPVNYHPADYFLCLESLIVYSQSYQLIFWTDLDQATADRLGIARRPLLVEGQPGYVFNNQEFEKIWDRPAE